jgi:HAD superfamily phosphoserine phosphatase-like hydrolase
MSDVVAVFDVDGTLLRGDCLWLAARRSRGPLGQMVAALTCLPLLLAWKLRLISTGRFKERAIAAFGVCVTVNQADLQGRKEWLLPELQTQLHPEGLQRLRWHQQRGDRVLLCSASPRMLLQPLADWLGVELLCTELQGGPGRWQPQLLGPNCKGAEKVRRLEAHLGSLNALTIEAYGDSKGDRELLKTAAIPHYRSFGPSPTPYPSFSLGVLLPVTALTLLGYGLLGLWSQGDQLCSLIQGLWSEIGIGLLLVSLGYGIRFGRWRLLLNAVQQHPPLPADARIWMGSYAFTATPGKAGEAVRSLLLRQECGVPMAPTLMALVVERLTDGTAVLLLLLINVPLLLRWQVPLAVPISLGLAALVGGWAALRSTWIRTRLTSNLKNLLPETMSRASGDGLAALRQLLRPELILKATLIGALAWSLEGVSLWLLLRAMGMATVTIGGSTLAHTAAGLLGALTLMPGGLGSTEAGTVGLLALQGVGLGKATAATLLIRLMTLWYATALGTLCLLRTSRRTKP